MKSVVAKVVAAGASRTLAKRLGRHYAPAAALSLRMAHRLVPADDYYARRAASALAKLGSFRAAADVCRLRAAAGDPLEYWKLYETFFAELADQAERKASGATQKKIALFNDTDRRTNIGCRLTSQHLKHALSVAFPDSELRSLPLSFKSLELKQIKVAGDVHQTIKALVAKSYGKTAYEKVLQSDLIALQPEGSLTEYTPLGGLAAFFSPILLGALLGKPTIIINGTIPQYTGSRGRFVKGVLGLAGRAAARDQITSENYGIAFLPDAGLLYEPVPYRDVRPGCLITTGARYSEAADEDMCRKALAICRAFDLRPFVLTKHSENFEKFKDEVAAMSGIFAETASLPAAAEVVSRCRLHVGARYHMAILSHLCGVPSLLFNVRTRKNEWLARHSDKIELVDAATDLEGAAKRLMQFSGDYPAPPDWLMSAYVETLRNVTVAAKEISGKQLEEIINLLRPA